jgi:hypothetical protein
MKQQKANQQAAQQPTPVVAGQPTAPTRTDAPEGAEAVLQQNQQIAQAAAHIASLAAAPLSVAAVSTPPVQANNPKATDDTDKGSPAKVTDDLEKVSPSFGKFVKTVGLAVAEAQTALDKTLVTTAKALSETEINVIAVYEQVIDDDGAMAQGNPITQKLPLVNYLMPTAYQWSRVYLEADMNVSQFTSDTGFHIQNSSFGLNANASASYGPLGFNASGGLSLNYNTSNTGVNNSTSQNTAAGKMHMEATLEPRHDIQLPQPFVVQRGPRLTVTTGALTEITDPPGSTKVIGHQVELIATLTSGQANTLGKALSDKSLSVSVDQPLLIYNLSNSGKTNEKGEMTITLQRKGAAYEPTKSMPTVIRVALGLVSQNIGLTL